LDRCDSATFKWEDFVRDTLAWAQHEIEQLNLTLYDQVNNDMQAALTAVFNAAKFERFAAHGPRKGPLTVGNPLAVPCFARLPGWNVPSSATTAKQPVLVEAAEGVAATRTLGSALSDTDAVAVGFGSEYPGIDKDRKEFCVLLTVNGERIMANNGWIWGGNALEDFAGPASRACVSSLLFFMHYC
jgi:hypothetical protein